MPELNDHLFDAIAEAACLGLILNGSSKAIDVFSSLTTDDFAFKENWRIYKCAEELRSQGEEISMATIQERLSYNGWSDKISNKYLQSFQILKEDDTGNIRLGHEANMIFSGVESAIKRVKDKARSRNLVGRLRIVTSGLVESTISLDDVCLELQTALLENMSGDNRATSSADILPDMLQHIQAVRAGISMADPTGVEGFDQLTGGLRGSDVLTISGQPKGGKSALALNISDNFVMRGKGVGYFSIEMPELELEQRRIVRRASLLREIGQFKFTEFENETLTLNTLMGGYGRSMSRVQADMAMMIADMLSKEPMYIFPPDVRDSRAISLEIQKLIDQKGIGLVIIDHMNLVTGAGTDNEIIKSLAQEVKYLANKNGVPGIILSQLNQEGNKFAEAFGSISSNYNYGSGELQKSGTIITNIWLENEKFECLCSNQIKETEAVIGTRSITRKGRKHEYRPTMGVCIECHSPIRELPDRQGGWYIERARSSKGGIMIPMIFKGEAMDMVELR